MYGLNPYRGFESHPLRHSSNRPNIGHLQTADFHFNDSSTDIAADPVQAQGQNTGLISPFSAFPGGDLPWIRGGTTEFGEEVRPVDIVGSQDLKLLKDGQETALNTPAPMFKGLLKR